MGILFFLTGTIIIGFTASLADSIYYLSPALTRSTATSLAHISHPLHSAENWLICKNRANIHLSHPNRPIGVSYKEF